MSAGTSGNSRSKNEHHSGGRDLLSRVDSRELKLLRVAVRRSNVTTTGPALPLERGIDDPAKIVPLVHYRKDEETNPKPPIFGRDIKVNQEFNSEERLVLADANKLDDQTRPVSRSDSRSLSRSPRGNKRSKSPRISRRRTSREERRSRSPRRNRSRSSTRVRRESIERKGYAKSKSKEKENYRKRSESSSRQRHNDYLYDKDRNRKSKSPTPLRPGEYRPNHPDLKLRYERRSRSPKDKDYAYIRHRRSRSSSRDRLNRPSTSRRSVSSPTRTRKYSRSPARAENRKRSVSPSHSRERRLSSDRYIASPKHLRRSRSPQKSYKSPTRRSRSPIRHERRSRSPGGEYRDPKKRRSPGISERSYRRHSRSPDRYKQRPTSRSPYKSKEYRRSSRSPHSRGYYKSDQRRSRSPAGRRINRTSIPAEHLPAEYGFYEPEYWMSAPVRPGYAPFPRFYPPAMYPRQILIPPRMPIIPPHYPPFRQQLPVYNSGAGRPKAKIVSKTTEVTSIRESTSSVQTEVENPRSAKNDAASSVTVQELTDTETKEKPSTSEGDQKHPDESSKESQGLHDD